MCVASMAGWSAAGKGGRYKGRCPREDLLGTAKIGEGTKAVVSARVSMWRPIALHSVGKVARVCA